MEVFDSKSIKTYFRKMNLGDDLRVRDLDVFVMMRQSVIDHVNALSTFQAAPTDEMRLTYFTDRVMGLFRSLVVYVVSDGISVELYFNKETVVTFLALFDRLRVYLDVPIGQRRGFFECDELLSEFYQDGIKRAEFDIYGENNVYLPSLQQRKPGLPMLRMVCGPNQDITKEDLRMGLRQVGCTLTNLEIEEYIESGRSIFIIKVDPVDLCNLRRRYLIGTRAFVVHNRKFILTDEINFQFCESCGLYDHSLKECAFLGYCRYCKKVTMSCLLY